MVQNLHLPGERIFPTASNMPDHILLWCCVGVQPTLLQSLKEAVGFAQHGKMLSNVLSELAASLVSLTYDRLTRIYGSTSTKMLFCQQALTCPTPLNIRNTNSPHLYPSTRHMGDIQSTDLE